MPYKDKDRAREYGREYLRKWRKWHKEQGLCQDCNKEAIEGHSHCLRHLLQRNLDSQKHFEKYRKQQLCYRCGMKATPGYAFCANCSYKDNFRERKYRQENREFLSPCGRKVKQKRLKEGRCYKCGAPLMEDESKYCFACTCNYNTSTMKGVLKYETAD